MALQPSVSTISGEYLAATTGAALHDISHVGRLHATGADGLDLLNRLSTNKVDELAPGHGTPTILTTENGRILDLIQVVNVGDHILMITSPRTQQSIIEWLDKYTIMEDLTIEDVSSETAMLALIGPEAGELLGLTPGQGTQTSISVHNIDLGGTDVVAVEQPLGTLSRYWLVCPQDSAAGLWEHLTGAGAVPVGATAMDAVRVNLGIPEHGPELGEPYNPLEAGLAGSVDFAKGCYIGQEVIARLDTYKKVQKYLVSLRFEASASVTAGDELLEEGQPVGTVTSVAPEATDGVLMGLGYVKAASATTGVVLDISGQENVSATIEAFAEPYGPAKD